MDDVATRRDALLSRRNALHERAMCRRAQLADSFHLQQFFRDSDELKSWVNEKMKTATDEAYKVTSCRRCHVAFGWEAKGTSHR